MKIQLVHKFEDIVNIDNLLLAWKEFIRGKRNKKDVQIFSFHLMDNILALHEDLENHTYKHGGYECFRINDPKSRIIHKAGVRDRLLHHAIYRILYPFFDKIFISDSFSCRNNKGTHKALNRFRNLARKVSNNNTKTCWILKCDIRKFFHSVDQKILIRILRTRIPDENIINLLEKIIFSFHSFRSGLGLPLGNLTSQLFANIYLNELDRFVKQKLKVKHYVRYTDDFVIVDRNKSYLENLILPISNFLRDNLSLELHPDKITIRKFHQGVDFLGYITLPHYRLLRIKTRKRIFRKMNKRIEDCEKGEISRRVLEQSLQSYFGVFSHANAYNFSEKLKNQFWAGGNRLM